MYVFFHRMPKHRAGSRKGWYARRRRSLNQQMSRLSLQQRNAFPTAQQMHEFILQARRMAADTAQPWSALAYIVLTLACAVINQAFPQCSWSIWRWLLSSLGWIFLDDPWKRTATDPCWHLLGAKDSYTNIWRMNTRRKPDETYGTVTYLQM